MSDLHELTALDQGAALAAGDLSATDLARHYLDRIATLDPEVGAFVTVTTDRALGRAAACDAELVSARRQGRRLGPLFGVPVAVKDIVRIDGVACTHGSRAHRDDVSDIDDHVVTTLERAGLVLLGTTNTPEFALPCYTENRVAPPTRNPWSAQHSPGGSSGGSAAAVAARLTPLAHGTDAGGSIRIPAAACGVVGLKPSRGRISNGPVAHDVTGLSVHGALGRTVADAAALVLAMSGTMPGDASTAPSIDPHPTHSSGAGQGQRRPLRVAALPLPMLPGLRAHPECLAAVDQAAAMLREAGHQVEELEMSADQQLADRFAQVWSVHAARVSADAEEEDLMPFTRYLRQRAQRVSGLELHEALSTFRGVGQLLADMFFDTYDALLTPTLAQPPALLGEFTSSTDEAVNYDRMTQFMPYTPLANITGIPAISLPVGWSRHDLPLAVMLATPYGDETTLADLATDLETATGAPGRSRAPARFR